MKSKEIYKRAFMLAVPMMIQNGITNMVSLIDNVMVGKLGTEAMTAVSIAGQLIFVFSLAIFGGLSGPGIFGAQFFGQGNTEGIKNSFRMKMIIAVVCSVIGMTIFALFGEELINLYLRGESGDIDKELTLYYAKEYLTIMLIQMLPFALIQVYATTLRETGDSVKPMVGGIASVIVDVVFNYILIYGKFGVPALGVKGAAIATVLARFVEFAVVIIWAHARKKKHTFLQKVFRTIKVPKDLAGKILIKGLPIFSNELLWAGGLAALTQCYSVRGLDIIAGLNISNALCNLLNVVFVSLGSAVGILTGQTLGAMEYEKAEKDAFSLMKFSCGICVLLTAILILLSGIFPKFYDTTEEIRSYGQFFIIITACFFPVQGFLNALYFTLRSGGKTLITFLFDSVYSWVICVPVAVILCEYTPLDVFLIYAIIQALDIIKIVIGYTLVKRRIWISNIVNEESKA